MPKMKELLKPDTAQERQEKVFGKMAHLIKTAKFRGYRARRLYLAPDVYEDYLARLEEIGVYAKQVVSGENEFGGVWIHEDETLAPGEMLVGGKPVADKFGDE